jgi:hypothetical protein
LASFQNTPTETIARRGLRRGLGLAFVLGLASCFVTPSSRTSEDMVVSAERTQKAPQHPVVVVIVVDGARWQDVFDGVDPKLAREKRLRPDEIVGADQLMPELYRITTTRGAAIGAPAHGEAIFASGPNYVSLPGYREILTGQRNGACVSNDCMQPSERTLADEFAAKSQGWATEVAVIASWPDLARAAARYPERIVVSAGQHAGSTRHFLRYDAEAARLLDAGAKVPPYPGAVDFRPDRYTAAIALRYLRTQKPRFLFLSLGEADAYAHKGLYREYLASLRHADAVVGEVDYLLDELRAQGYPTTLMVTSDHGRSKHFSYHGIAAPESARTWLVATGSGIRARGWVSAPVERRLSDIAPTVRKLAGLPIEQTEGGGSVLTELSGG